MIESKLTFLDEQVEVLLWDSIVLSEYAFGLIPEVLNTVDVVMFLLGKMSAVVDAVVMESRYIQCVVAAVTVRINNAVRCYFPYDNGHKRIGLGV